MEAKTLGLSGRGTHIHSTRPVGAIRQLTSQSERNAYSAMGGNGLATRGSATCGPISTTGAWPSPLTAVTMDRPRSPGRALRAIFCLYRELIPLSAA